MGRIAVVDADDRFVRWTDKVDIHRNALLHRSVHVLLFDDLHRLVVQRRSDDKATDPGRWDCSCAGHVEEEDYVDGPDGSLDLVYAAVARRELREELGVSVEPVEVAHIPPIPGVNYEQLRLFAGRCNGPFVLQVEEVAEVRHLSCREVHALLRDTACTATLRWLVDRMDAYGLWDPSSGAFQSTAR